MSPTEGEHGTYQPARGFAATLPVLTSLATVIRVRTTFVPTRATEQRARLVGPACAFIKPQQYRPSVPACGSHILRLSDAVLATTTVTSASDLRAGNRWVMNSCTSWAWLRTLLVLRFTHQVILAAFARARAGGDNGASALLSVQLAAPQASTGHTIAATLPGKWPVHSARDRRGRRRDFRTRAHVARRPDFQSKEVRNSPARGFGRRAARLMGGAIAPQDLESCRPVEASGSKSRRHAVSLAPLPRSSLVMTSKMPSQARRSQSPALARTGAVSFGKTSSY